MTPDQQKLYALFTQTLTEFQKAAAEVAFGGSKHPVQAEQEREYLEELRAELLDAYTSALAQQ